jgi:hypothetical protein
VRVKDLDEALEAARAAKGASRIVTVEVVDFAAGGGRGVCKVFVQPNRSPRVLVGTWPSAPDFFAERDPESRIHEDYAVLLIEEGDMSQGRTYLGKRGFSGHTDVWIERPGGAMQIHHVIRHSPDGFEWGYSGSGPSDLALSICWDALGYEPRPASVIAVRDQLIATIQGDEWELTLGQVMDVIAREREGDAYKEEPNVETG